MFTCLNIRAVHLEIMTDMKTETFIHALRRFIALCGTPAKIFSDNAKNFHLADKTIQRIWNVMCEDENVTTYLTRNNITWQFIPERSPWMGGFWERMVQTVKQPLRKAIGRTIPDSNLLRTLLYEAATIVNSRPLTYVSQDITNYHVIRPADFLCLNPSTGIPSEESIEIDPDSGTNDVRVLHAWTYGQKQLNKFWKAWLNSYLPALRQRHQSDLKGVRVRATPEPAVGDVAILHDDNLKRGQWKLVRVTELIAGADGKFRTAVIKLPSGHCSRRAIKLLYPLECAGPVEEELHGWVDSGNEWFKP